MFEGTVYSKTALNKNVQVFFSCPYFFFIHVPISCLHLPVFNCVYWLLDECPKHFSMGVLYKALRETPEWETAPFPVGEDVDTILKKKEYFSDYYSKTKQSSAYDLVHVLIFFLHFLLNPYIAINTAF